MFETPKDSFNEVRNLFLTRKDNEKTVCFIIMKTGRKIVFNIEDKTTHECILLLQKSKDNIIHGNNILK